MIKFKHLVVAAASVALLAGTVSPTQAATAPISLSMSQLHADSAQIPGMTGKPSGTEVLLWDDGSVTDQIWQGTYVFRPAGSAISAGPMYARWKDGLVAINLTPKDANNEWPGTLDASFVRSDDGAPYQTVRTLVKDDNDSSVWRIPENAWLFRVDAKGNLIALVDVLVLKQGGPTYTTMPGADGMHAEIGAQPVPVKAGYSR
jgi:hypothetical protein